MYKGVMSLVENESCQMYKLSHVTCRKWVMSHLYMSHVRCINESCHMYKWVMSHVNEFIWWTWLVHVQYGDESCHVVQWVWSRAYTIRIISIRFILSEGEKSVCLSLSFPVSLSFSRARARLLSHSLTHSQTHTLSPPSSSSLALSLAFTVPFSLSHTHIKVWSCQKAGIGPTYEWVMAHLWMSHEWDMNHGKPMNESRHTYEWVMAFLWMSHEWDMSHGTHMNQSRHT